MTFRHPNHTPLQSAGDVVKHTKVRFLLQILPRFTRNLTIMLLFMGKTSRKKITLALFFFFFKNGGKCNIPALYSRSTIQH